MFSTSLAFDRPAYLALLAVIPAMWWLGYRSLAGLGRWRRALALTLRSLVALAIILALADIQFRRRNDQLTVVYLLDQSLSIPAETRQAMLDYVAASVGDSPERRLDDRYAVIAFGRDAAIEVPPVDATLAVPPRLETVLDPEATDLATAVERAQALFPPDAVRRIVLVTDGNENRGNVYREARAAAEAGVGIDVVAVPLAPRGDVAVEKIDMPAGVRRSQPFDVRIVLSHDAPADAAAPIAGALQVIRKSGDGVETTVAEQDVLVEPGRQVLTVREEIDLADFYSYEVRFVPDDPSADGVAQNNAAGAFTHIQGQGHVLLIENYSARGQFDHLVERLRAQDIEVTTTTTDRLFNSLAELQRYDAVILANVSRSEAEDGDAAAAFSDEQIEMLVRNTREMGCGLIMLGGPDTYGAGGWANTPLEEAMPVDFQIKAAEARMVGALSIVIDRSGSMDGEKLAMSKAAAIAAIRTMGRRDLVSVVAFDGAASSIVPLRRVGDYRSAASRVDAIGSGGGTDMYPGMVMGFADLRKAEASVKHMIVLTDGQTPDAEFDALVSRMRRAQISVTAVAVGADANIPLLQRIATRGGGKFYAVNNPRNLPRIFLREVRRVARPLVFEPPSPVLPQFSTSHEILDGFADGVPPIRGLVLTTVKDNPLVEVLLRSPQPPDPKNATLLATWTYGAGKAAALTTDAGQRWASAWTQWEGYDKFFQQLVRWAMRPTSDAGRYTVATTVRDGRTQIVVNALNADDEFVNDQTMTARVIRPDLQDVEVQVEQVAPGRYVGEFPSEDAGMYLIAVTPSAGGGTIRTGVAVGYSPEYRDRETNMPLLASLARLRAGEGPPGVLTDGVPSPVAADPAANPFRRDLPHVRSSQSIWPWVIVAASCLFWGDVFVRRVQVDLSGFRRFANRLRDRLMGRPAIAAEPATISRLQSRKSEIAGQLERQRAAARFGHDDRMAERRTGDALPLPTAQAPPAPQANVAQDQPQAPAEASYTERLLKAKRDAQRRPPGR